MDQKRETPKPTQDHPRRSTVRSWLILAVIAFGFLSWFFGLAVGLAAGSSPNRGDDWLVPLSELVGIGGPILAIVGVVWLFVRPPR